MEERDAERVAEGEKARYGDEVKQDTSVTASFQDPHNSSATRSAHPVSSDSSPSRLAHLRLLHRDIHSSLPLPLLHRRQHPRRQHTMLLANTALHLGNLVHHGSDLRRA